MHKLFSVAVWKLSQCFAVKVQTKSLFIKSETLKLKDLNELQTLVVTYKVKYFLIVCLSFAQRTWNTEEDFKSVEKLKLYCHVDTQNDSSAFNPSRLAPVQHAKTDAIYTGAVGSHSQGPGSMVVRCIAQGNLGLPPHQSLSCESRNWTANLQVIGRPTEYLAISIVVVRTTSF